MAWRLRALTLGGALGAAAVGGTVYAFAPPSASLCLVTFFASSSALTRLPGGVADRDLKGRRLSQVLANGAVASAGAVLTRLRGGPKGLAMIGGALSTAAGDTWSTEIGTRYGGTPRLVTTWRAAPRGSNGAVSPVGTLASIAGSTVVSGVLAIGVARDRRPRLLLACTAGGVAGALVDSLLGATLESAAERAGGRLSNDQVNFLSTAVGAGVAALLVRSSLSDHGLAVSSG